jgi:dolichol-phosphate mannosyltransferase
MSEEYAATVEAPPRFRARVRRGVRTPHNWMELVRFAIVGASGYVVNLAVFTLFVHGVGTHYRVAAFAAFLVAVTNNFWWNRHWTFKAHQGHAGHQSAKFLAVSVAAFIFNLIVLELLVAGLDAPEVPAQAVAIAAATPLSFVGNKLWSFAR